MTGKFSDDGREYILNTPDTPARWLNYLSNGRYGTFIQPDGGGYSFWRDASYHGILNWTDCRENLNRVVYLNDGRRYWKVNRPEKDSDWEVRIGLEHQTIRNRTGDIAAVLTYFVPPDRDLEYWHLRLENTGRAARRLQVFAAAELSLGNTLRAYVSHEMNLYARGWEERGALYATTTLWGRGGTMQENVHWPLKAFFTATRPCAGFDCNRSVFLGDGRTGFNPVAVENGKCGNSITRGRTPIFALHFSLELKPGQSRELALGLGVVPEKAAAPKITLPEVRRERRKAKHFWDDMCASGVTVRTPDRHLDTAINFWNRKQALINFWWYRTAAAPHLIEGDMSGFRDAVQPTIGMTPVKPRWAKKKILKLTGLQYRDGGWCHMFDFLTYRGPASSFSDVHLWLPMVIFDYLKETGDFALLEKETPYQDGGRATVREHIEKTLDFVLKARGRHGLSLLKSGDWNDGLNFAGRGGKGESVMVTQTLSYVLKEWTLLNRKLKKDREARRAIGKAEELDRAVNRHAWDGHWYVRAFTDAGKPIGSRRNKAGRIFINSQTWAVMSGGAPDGRAAQCMKSLVRHLETPFGPTLLAPSFSRIDPAMGLITRCAPGEGENGSVFMHPIPWAIIALAMVKDRNAYSFYRNSLFSRVARDARYKAEPYVYPEIISGPESPHFGEGMRGWLTGCAAWFFRACTDYLLGIRPEYDGLTIDPCIDPDWPEYSVARTFRNRQLAITVRNPKRVHCGVKTVILNGQRQNSNFIPVQNLKKSNTVEVILGKHE